MNNVSVTRRDFLKTAGLVAVVIAATWSISVAKGAETAADAKSGDDARLPRVLVVGDSISMNYHEAAKAALKGVANYHRIEGNSSSTVFGVENMELWLGKYEEEGQQWDVIQFNHGLHDLKQKYDKINDTWGKYSVSIDAYKKNLEKEIEIMKKTGAKLVWCSTTPVPNSNKGRYARRKGAALEFNKAALEVMHKHPEIQIHDLHQFVCETKAFDKWRQGGDVHYWTKDLQAVLGKTVAGEICKALESKAAIEKQASAIMLGVPFSNNAVFQQQIPVPVWGTSRPGSQITVDFEKQTKTTIANDDGSWKVTLDPMTADKLSSVSKAPEGKALTVTGTLGKGTATITLKNILVGEVWLCSGQSNMAAKVRHNHANQDPNDNLLKSNYPAIRHVSAPGGWQMATPEHVREFTRVGFCFARKVHLEQKVPIGLLNACAGGSRIESWMRVPPTKLPTVDPKQKQVTYGGLYSDRLAPLVGYGIRGALWYQGEANAGEGHTYFLKMESLINDWRNSWQLGDFPFYIVQLAGIGQSTDDNPAMGDGRAKIRESQRQVLSLKNTGMAVAVDIGSEREHPANKVEVGIRLAHWALHHAYDRSDVVPSGPLYKSHKIEGATIRVSFDAAKSGLMIADKEGYHPPKPTPGAELPWLSIQAKDGSWHWSKGKIDGSDLIVSSKEVKQPVAVRYAYTQHPLGVYLYNKEGLPATPFSTSGY